MSTLQEYQHYEVKVKQVSESVFSSLECKCVVSVIPRHMMASIITFPTGLSKSESVVWHPNFNMEVNKS